MSSDRRNYDASCSPEWLYGTASSAPRQTSLRLRRQNTGKKDPASRLGHSKTAAKRRPMGLSVISAKTVDEMRRRRLVEIKAAGSIFSLKQREDGGGQRRERGAIYAKDPLFIREIITTRFGYLAQIVVGTRQNFARI